MKLFVCLVFLLHAVGIYGKGLPKEISQFVCRKSDPEINQCYLDTAKVLLPLLANGVPEVNLVPLDPLNVEFMTAEGETETVKVKLAMKNITLHGIIATDVYRVKFDPETLSGEFSFRVPYIRMTTEYFSSGRLFGIPLESSANFDGNFTDTDMTINLRLKTKQRKGVEYFTVDKLKMKMRVETARINLVSFNPKQQPATDLIQNFFNENDRLTLDAVNPIVVQQSPEFWKHVIERVLRVVPAAELLPN